MKIRKVNESIDLKEAAEDKIPDIDPKDSVAEIADAITDQVEIATGEEKTVADSDAKVCADLFGSLDERPGRTGEEISLWTADTSGGIHCGGRLDAGAVPGLWIGCGNL